MSEAFEARLAQDVALIDGHLAKVLASRADLPVVHAMRYALKGGKKLRGFMVLESARIFGLTEGQALPVAAAVEALHTYSLVHDDLPAMDDDDLRRGQPTVHVKWDEASAILAGDALQTLAFELITDPAIGPAERRIALVGALARASGVEGMVLGQALDIAAETAATPLTLDEITKLQAGKTGALIGFAATSGALIAGEDPAPLAAYAKAVGLAFQIWDDVLDVEGDAAQTGKRVGKDAQAGKATFVSLLGLQEAKIRAQALIDGAESALSPYGDKAANLIAAARFTIARQA